MAYISKIKTLDGTTYDIRDATNEELAFDVTLSASSWSNNSITVSNANFLASGYAYLVKPDAQSFDDWCACRIYGSNVTTDGSMTFTCATTPTSNIVVNVLRKVVT